jgi:hypothetical protein
MGRVAWSLVFLALGLELAGCPGKTSDGSGSTAPTRCESFGQTCQFAPGKLGSCVQRTDCTQGDCLMCQSQH